MVSSTWEGMFSDVSVEGLCTGYVVDSVAISVGCDGSDVVSKVSSNIGVVSSTGVVDSLIWGSIVSEDKVSVDELFSRYVVSSEDSVDFNVVATVLSNIGVVSTDSC